MGTRERYADRGLFERVRRQIGSVAVDNGFRGLSFAGRALPVARRLGRRVVVERNFTYREMGSRAHRVDVYRPRDATGPLPVVIYLHGGGFRILSKDTHWIMALQFAARGALVFNVDYRLSREAPFPAAIEDACHAYAWVVEHAKRWGGDLDRLVLAGESAGGNLVTSLALAAAEARPEPWAHRVYETGVVPSAVIAACGILQVSDVERFARRRDGFPRWLMDRLEEVRDAYLPDDDWSGPGGAELADPLVALETRSPGAFERELPPFYAPCGTKDPLLDDTRRLEAALVRHGGRCHVTIHPGEPHAFHAFVWRDEARRCWGETFRFLEREAGIELARLRG